MKAVGVIPQAAPVRCSRCGAETTADGACPACLLDRGWMFEENRSDTAGNFLLPSFGDYELLEEIARGGMGVVYKARQRSLNRIVAVKMVLSGKLASASELKRFRAEAETAAKLQHPNIVAIHEVGEFEGQPFFSMDYVEGRSLAELAHNQPLPAKRAAGYLKTIAEAVEYAHTKGVLHRDLKPSNILLDQNDQPRITDFGLAKRLDDSQLSTPEPQLTLTGQVLGSPNFMPPEQATGDRKAMGAASDVYSLGAILYQLITGRPPFMAETLTRTLRLVAETEPVSPRLLNPGTPKDLETICAKCLHKDRRRRYMSSQDLAAELGRFVRDEPILARPAGRSERLWRWSQRHPTVAGLSAVVAALLITVVLGSIIYAGRLRDANRHANESLCEAYLSQARAARSSGQAGRRFGSLDALRKAARISPSLDLRNEAIACLALTDLRTTEPFVTEHPGKVIVYFSEATDRYAALDFETGRITVRRRRDGRELMRQDGFKSPVSFGSMSPNGNYLALAAGSSLTELRVWDIDRSELILKYPGKFGVRRVNFSPDSAKLAVVDSTGDINLPPHAVWVYDLRAKKPSQSLSRLEHHASAADFDPTGCRLAVCSDTTTNLEIWDAQNGNLLKSIPLPRPAIGSIWHPRGRLVAAACRDMNLYILDTLTGSTRGVLRGHQAETVGLSFTHGGDFLLSSSWDGTTRLWDPFGGQLPVRIGGSLDWLSNNDEKAAFKLGGAGLAWGEVALGHECRILHSDLEPDKGPRDCGFSADGRWLVSAHSDGARFWDTANGRELGFLPLGYTWSAIIHPDGRRFFTYGQSGLREWQIRQRVGPAGLELEVVASRQLGFQGAYAPACLSADGKTLAAIHGGTVRVLDVESGNQTAQFTAPGRFVALSPDGELVAIGAVAASSASTRVYEVRTGSLVKEIHSDSTDRLAFSPDGRVLATVNETECSFWKAGSWERLYVLARGDGGGGTGPIGFTYDSRIVAVPWTTHVVRLLDTATWQELATLEAPLPQYLSSLSFSPDGGMLAVGNETKQIHLWDLRRIRSELAEMNLDWETPPLPPTNQTNAPLPIVVIGPASQPAQQSTSR
jgi:serine/threonine protein kinase/WD40 repeat protein